MKKHWLVLKLERDGWDARWVQAEPVKGLFPNADSAKSFARSQAKEFPGQTFRIFELVMSVEVSQLVEEDAT